MQTVRDESLRVTSAQVNATDRVQATDWTGLDRVSLWPQRWPYIALQVCVDAVSAVPPEDRDRMRWEELPCELCPENGRCLTAKEKEVGPLMFDREYLTTPRSGVSSLFPMERMEPMLHRDLALVDLYRKPYGAESRYMVGTAWDFAWSERAGGDYLAKITGRLDRQTGKIRVLDMNRWQRLSFEAQCDLIEAEHARYFDDFVVFEEEGAQLVWRQYVTGRSSVPVIPHGAGEKRNLKEGVPGLLIDVSRRRWEIPYQAGTRNHDEVRQFLSECEHFGWHDDKLEGVGEHDDYVMAWWHLRWGFEKFFRPAGRRQQPQGGDTVTEL